MISGRFLSPMAPAMIASPAVPGPSIPSRAAPPVRGRAVAFEWDDCKSDDADLHGQQGVSKEKIAAFFRTEDGRPPFPPSTSPSEAPVKPPTDSFISAGRFPSPEDVAGAVADRVLRADVGRPGFALLDLGPDGGPPSFRSWLLRLASALSGESVRRFGRSLRLLSADRFDQQATTQPHRDRGPDDSVLLLGYEPTEVLSRLVLIDYTHAALDRGLAPADFLARFNPMARPGEDVLAPYAAEAAPFDAGHFRVAVVNNGSRPPGPDSAGMLGVLHQAT